MSATYYDRNDIAEVRWDFLDRLRRSAAEEPLKRSRLCLHHSSDDLLHEMIVMFHRDSVIRPHRHFGKSKSFHLIEGEIDVLMFDDEGQPTRRVRMNMTPEGVRIYRLSRPVWHTVVVKSEFAAIHEVTNGPFVSDENAYAPWSPQEPDALRAFVRAAEAVLDG